LASAQAAIQDKSPKPVGRSPIGGQAEPAAESSPQPDKSGFKKARGTVTQKYRKEMVKKLNSTIIPLAKEALDALRPKSKVKAKKHVKDRPVSKITGRPVGRPRKTAEDYKGRLSRNDES
jgi:hypothetical protein